MKFRLFGHPVRVTFWFWIAAVLVAIDREPVALMIWVGVCLVSILLHELGHIVAYRFCGIQTSAVLYGWGGLTIPDHEPAGPLASFVVSLAGPAAGFCVTALTLAVAHSYGATIEVGFRLFLPTISAWPTPLTVSNWYWSVLLNDVLFVNFYWGLVNLLPIYPLDGGQAARTFLAQLYPLHGRRHSLVTSASVSAAVALFSLSERNTLWAIFFAVLAVVSLQVLETARDRLPRPHRSPE